MATSKIGKLQRGHDIVKTALCALGGMTLLHKIEVCLLVCYWCLVQFGPALGIHEATVMFVDLRAVAHARLGMERSP